MDKIKEEARHHMNRLTQQIRSERGNSLLLAIVAILLLSTFSVVTLSVVVTDNRVTAHSLEASKAVWLAEAGVERALFWLRQQNPPPSGTDSFVLFDHDSLSDGTYSVTIQPLAGNVDHYLKKYDILATGNEKNILKGIRVRVKSVTFAQYAYLSGSEGQNIYFITGDVIEGPLHSNDQISISGSPVFQGKVTSSANSFNETSGSNPIFAEGYQLGVPVVDFPTPQDVLDNYYTENSDAPLTIDATGSKHADLEFTAKGEIKYSVWHFSDETKVYDVHDAHVKLTDTHGLIYVENDATVKGVVKGQVTLLATGDLTIVDDIKYSKVEPDGKPKPDCQDLLGMISGGDIIIADNAANDRDVRIDGALLALGNSLCVENNDSGTDRGKLTIYGSLGQAVRGPIKAVRSNGSTTGYTKDYHYDQRLCNTIPPYFPRTGQYDVTSWQQAGR